LKNKTHQIIFLSIAITLLLLVGVNSPNEAHAEVQLDAPYENLSIYIMPQYKNPEEWEDVPSVFIGLYGTLRNDVDTPLEEVRIPFVGIDGDFHLTLVGDTVDEKIVDIEAEVDEATKEVVWQLEQPLKKGETYDFLVEYFIKIKEEEQTYTIYLPYKMERDADLMDLLVFEPFNAETFEIESDLGEIESTDQFGLKVHKVDIGEVEANTEFNLTIQYEKPDYVTTLEAIESLTEQAERLAEASEQMKEQEEDTGFFTVENIVMIVLATVIIAILIILIIFNRRKKQDS